MSEAAIIWAEAPHDGLDVLSKAVLAKLASVADDDDGAWMRVADLAERVGCGERVVQLRLRKLEALGFIRDSGRTHRLGTRAIPIYTLSVDHVLVMDVLARRRARRNERAETASRMGAPACTHSRDEDEAMGARACAPMGASACTPNETIQNQAVADATATGARADEGEGFAGDAGRPEPGSEPTQAFEAAFRAWAPHAVQSTEWEPSWPAWCEQAALAGGEGRLAACVAAYLAHPSMASRKAPLKGFQTWLRSGGWRATASAIEAAEAKGRPAVGRRFEGPADVWEFAVLQLGEANARSYVLPAAWADEGRTLTPRNGVAWERLRKFDWAGVNVTLINPRAGQ